VNHLLCSGSKARWCPSCPLIALSKSAWSLSHLLYNTNKVYWIEKGGGKNYQKCVWYCWKFVPNWQPLLFPCNFQMTAMAAQCLSLNDAHWIIIFNHRWKVDVEVCSKSSRMRGGGWGLGGTCESCLWYGHTKVNPLGDMDAIGFC
jgi:hypothetical protein